MFKLTHAVLDIFLKKDNVGFAVCTYNGETITVEILITENPYIKTFFYVSQFMSDVTVPDINFIRDKVLSLLLPKFTELEPTIRARRISYTTSIKSNPIYLTKDYGEFGNKIFVNINNEIHFDYPLETDLNVIYSQLLKELEK